MGQLFYRLLHQPVVTEAVAAEVPFSSLLVLV